LVFSAAKLVTLGDGSVLTWGDGEVRKRCDTSERSGQTSSLGYRALWTLQIWLFSVLLGRIEPSPILGAHSYRKCECRFIFISSPQYVCAFWYLYHGTNRVLFGTIRVLSWYR